MRFTKLAKRLGLIIIALVAVLLATGSFLSPVQAQQNHPVVPPPVDHRARDAYWALRYGPITPTEYQNAVRQGQALPRANSLPAANSTGIRPLGGPNPPSGVWTAIGPAPINSPFGGGRSAGRLAGVAIDPTTSGAGTTIYIASAGGGVWKSTNNGTSWVSLTDSQPSLAAGAIAIDPNNHLTIYVGTGESNQSLDSYRGAGILKSTDGGSTWTQLGLSTFGNRQNSFSRIAIDPRTGDIFAASTFGLFVSTNGGTTWTNANGVPPNSNADDVAINTATNPSTIFATDRFNGLYVSRNGGTSFALATTGLPANPATFPWNRSSIAIAPSNPSTMYLAISDGSEVYNAGGFNGGFYSNDAGVTWHQMASLNNDFTDGEPWYAQAFAVDPKNPDLVYGGGVNMWYTPNAQAASGNWVTISNWAASNSLHADQHGIAFAPNCAASPCTAYFANDGGLYTSSNPASQVYTDLNNAPLGITEFTGGDLGANFSTTGSALGGSQDNGTDLYQGNPVWNETFGGDGGFTQIDQTNPNYMYSEYIYGQVVQSTNGGGSFNCIDPTGNGCFSVNPPGGTLFYAPLVLDRSDDNHLAAGVLGTVYETTTAKTTATWYQGGQSLGGNPSAIAIAPKSSAIIYVGLDNGTFWRTASAHSGSQATYAQMVTPNGASFISSIAVDPNDVTSNTVFVTTGQTNGVHGGIFKSVNGGASWTNITGTLPAYPINTAVVYYSGATRVIVVGTDYGVYFTTNDGTSWQGVGSGLPNVPVTQLALDKALTTIAAYTHGRGTWTLSLAGPASLDDTIGVYRTSSTLFLLRNSNTTGNADIAFAYSYGSQPSPVVGTWTTGGSDTIGLYDRSNGQYFLRNANAAGTPDEQFVLGNPNDEPIGGQWQVGAGHDGVGVFRPSNGLLLFRNALSTGFADYVMVLGVPGDQGLAGDWGGVSHDGPGVYRPSSQLFLPSNTICNCSVFADYTAQLGNPGDSPVTGDWIAQGHAGIGVFRPTNGLILLKNQIATGFADIVIVYGIPNDVPIAGHWTANVPALAKPPNVLVAATAAPVGTPNPGLGNLGG